MTQKTATQFFNECCLLFSFQQLNIITSQFIDGYGNFHLTDTDMLIITYTDTDTDTNKKERKRIH